MGNKKLGLCIEFKGASEYPQITRKIFSSETLG